MLSYLILLMASSNPSLMRQVLTRFVLIQTNHNGNVGAAARAMKTMGFENLALVQPRDPKVLNRDKTKHGASGALDVLEQTTIYESVQDAIQGVDHVCATGMPHSMQLDRPQQEYRAPRDYFSEVLSKENNNDADPIRIAFLFGNERFGMRPDDIDLCETVLGIPTNPDFGSLNLASAVQLIGYDWREAIGGYSIHGARIEGGSAEDE